MIPGFVAFDGLVGVYTGGSVGGLTTVGTNEPTNCDGIAGPPDIKHDFQAVSGTNYHFAVAGNAGAQGNIVAEVFQRPSNDDFANAETLVGLEGQATGDNIFASEEAGEPVHLDSPPPPAGSVWYRWTAPMDGRALFSTCGSEAFVEFKFYTGTSVASLQRVEPLVAAYGCGGGLPGRNTAAIAATKGTTYWIGMDSRMSSSGGITVSYDEVKIPETTITAGPTGPTNDATPTFEFKSSVANSGFQCRLDGPYLGPCSGPGASHTPGSNLSDGSYTFSVRAYRIDAFDRTPATRSFTVDTLPPQTAITAGPLGLTHDRTPTFKFASSETGGRFQCMIRRAGGSGSFAACSGPSSTHTPKVPLVNGSYAFKVRARDRAGNLDPSAARRLFTVSG